MIYKTFEEFKDQCDELNDMLPIYIWNKAREYPKEKIREAIKILKEGCFIDVCYKHVLLDILEGKNE